ncbi:PREDICTED: uncharacterized protein LOC106113988 [Papilio xuthus]|uniref:Uncharacterized protein LOC106113988 n=1 Tax=Papilio xuthus TaxID=66420 RepID=A0AAJ6Z0B8_PAPXU|nr:PREDICTED: uncharacterized protein LOC106113988 [Papilio xuthus]
MVSCKWLINLARNYTKCCSPPTSKKILSKIAYNDFINSLPVILDKGVRETQYLVTDELRNRMKRIAEYYLRGRKTVHGEVTIFTHDLLRQPEKTEGDLKKQLHVLAWSAELILSYFLIVDDIEDGARSRNGQPCWHLLEDVGSLASNDASMLRSFIMQLLNINFSSDLFVDFAKLFNEVFFICNVGQYLDAVTSKNRNYDNFTMKNYKNIALNKYAVGCINFPVLCALILSNKYNKDTRQLVDNILTDVGIWSQINNDFTDYYDSEEQTGKTGSDIQEGKCTWLAVTALQRCSTAQREEFIANYGSWQPDHVARIRDIYHQLGIIDIYYREEQTTYDRIINKIESLPANSMLSADFFKTVVDAYYPNVACGKSFRLRKYQRFHNPLVLMLVIRISINQATSRIYILSHPVFPSNMVAVKWLLNLSRNYCKWRPPQKQKKILPQEAYNSFINSLPVIIDNGVQQTKYLETDELHDRMKRIAEYYMRGRKTIQGELTILGHELLKSEKIEGDLNNQQYVLAWCVELLMSYILILDDIEDGARSRNGQPCWHLLEDVGSLASNDASMLRSFIMQLLNINFSSQLFVDFAKLFNEAFFTCNVGQYLDAITSKQRNYKNFTMDYYKNIALYKYAYYSVKFPILSALVLSNKYNKETCRYVDDILTDVGIWSQINNDFTDYYDDDEQTGKTGSDIQEGKCTWLAVTALQRCSPTQREEFVANYGSWQPDHVTRIRDIYQQLGIVGIYYREERSTYDRILKKIESLPANAVPSADFFKTVVETYYPNVACGKSFIRNN